MTMLQSGRAKDPYPFTWEIPAAAFAVWVLLAVLAAHTGRALANITAGAGWTWPSSRALFTSLPALLAGDPRAGLASLGGAASPAALAGWIITVEVLLLAATIAGSVWAARRWGPGRMKGMASRAEAEAVLGITRLRNTARIIRPDLFPSGPTRGIRFPAPRQTTSQPVRRNQ